MSARHLFLVPVAVVAAACGSAPTAPDPCAAKGEQVATLRAQADLLRNTARIYSATRPEVAAALRASAGQLDQAALAIETPACRVEVRRAA